MSLEEIKYPEDLEYSSDSKNKPLDFYISTISEAKKIDLKLGFFSSNAIRVLSVGFANFIYNGGKIRIITNHFLSKQDKENIFENTLSEEDEKYVKTIVKEDIETLEQILKEGELHFFNCLKYLSKQKLLQIQPVKLKTGGMSHYKEGIISNTKEEISFSGSCNFTYQGLVENGETLTVNRSWGNNVEKTRIEKLKENFENIFNKRHPDYEYLNKERIITLINQKGEEKGINELLEDEIKLINKARKNYKLGPIVHEKLGNLKTKIDNRKDEPYFPFPEGPREYQKQAYENWVKNGRKGIFAMATGTGKTITALNALYQEYLSINTYQALILVPTNVLMEQWKEEANSFNFKNIYQISSKFDWETNTTRLITSLTFNKEQSFIIISTYASFTKQKVQKLISKLPNETIMIADEAHNIASPSIKRRLKNIQINKRIALTATPKRAYDPEGNQVIEKFFNSQEPYTFNYSMEKAIENEVLTKYYYYPIIVNLTNDEMEKYYDISLRLYQLYDNKKKAFKNEELAKTLLMNRKSIIHKAENKIPAFNQIIENLYKENNKLNYTFVYVPEGFKDTEDDNQEAVETRMINLYLNEVYKIIPKVRAFPFLGETKDKDSLLNKFSSGEIDILASMKCLDEGVDIPRAENAIFCASTGNPRQFIQRRGRILRKHPNKTFANIYDLIVSPYDSNMNIESFSLEQNLIKKELERVSHFASLAINKFQALEKFETMCQNYGLNIYSLQETLKY